MPAAQEANLPAAAALLEQLEPGRGDPLGIDVDQEDGDRVQVYIGKKPGFLAESRRFY